MATAAPSSGSAPQGQMELLPQCPSDDQGTVPALICRMALLARYPPLICQGILEHFHANLVTLANGNRYLYLICKNCGKTIPEDGHFIWDPSSLLIHHIPAGNHVRAHLTAKRHVEQSSCFPNSPGISYYRRRGHSHQFTENPPPSSSTPKRKRQRRDSGPEPVPNPTPGSQEVDQMATSPWTGLDLEELLGTGMDPPESGQFDCDSLLSWLGTDSNEHN